MRNAFNQYADDRLRRAMLPIQGQLLRQSEHRAVAIYLWHGSTWVADFVGDRGVLVDVDTWFRFNCGTLGNSRALRRMSLEAAMPLSPEIILRIEALHRAAGAQRNGILARWACALSSLLPRGRIMTLVASRFHRRNAPRGHAAL